MKKYASTYNRSYKKRKVASTKAKSGYKGPARSKTKVYRKKTFKRKYYKRKVKPSKYFARKVQKVMAQTLPWVHHRHQPPGERWDGKIGYMAVRSVEFPTQNHISTFFGADMLNRSADYITKPFWLEIDKCELLLSLQNNTNYAQQVKIYCCQARVDHDKNAAQDWIDGNNNIGLTTADGNSMLIGATPFESLQFTKHWKVNKVKTMTLEPGTGHIHKIKAWPLVKKWVRSDKLQYGLGGASNTYLRKYTQAYVVTYRGFLMHDKTDETKVNYNAPLLDITLQTYYSCRQQVSNPIEYKATQANTMVAVPGPHFEQYQAGMVVDAAH